MLLIRTRILGLLGLTFSAAAFCGPATVALGGESVANAKGLAWRGCGITQQAFMRECAKAYEAEKGLSIVVSGGGAALGIRSVAGGSADLGGTCRHTMAESFDSERGVKSVVIAWDALVVVAHASTPVDDITHHQLVDIFNARIRNWKDLGGTDQEIILVGRKGNESGVGVMSRLLILDDPDFEYPHKAILLRSSRPLELLVEKTPGTIAITGVSSARKRNLKILSIDGVHPTAAQIAPGAYRYFRPLFLAFAPTASDETLGFIRWIQGDSAQAVIAEQGTVNLAMGAALVSKYRHWNNKNPPINLEQLRRAGLTEPKAVLTNDVP